MVMSEEEKKQKHREYQRKWREANPDKATQIYNDWVEANREKRRASWRKYGAKRRAKLQAERDAELKRIEDAGNDL